MKKIIFLFFAFLALKSNAQIISEVYPTDGQVLEKTEGEMPFHAKTSEVVYAIVLSIDAEAKFLKKNKAVKAITNTNTDELEGFVPFSDLSLGWHTLYVKIYSDPRTIIEEREVMFYLR